MKVYGPILILGSLFREGVATPAPEYGYTPCPADRCFSAIRSKPALASTASSFCKTYITRTTSIRTSTKTKTQTVTVNPSVKTVISTVYATATSQITTTQTQAIVTSSVTATSTETATSTPPQNTVTVTSLQTTFVGTETSVCATAATTVGRALPTVVNYPGLQSGSNQKRDLEERDDRRKIPSQLSGPNCGSGAALMSKVKSACSCYLGPAYTTVTSTKTVRATVTAPAGYGYSPRRATTITTTLTRATVTSTITAPAPADSTVTSTVATTTETATITANTPQDATVTATSLVSSTSTQCSTTTITTYSGLCGGPSVTATTYGTGIYTCTAATQPQATAARFRIEASDSVGTLWDGCVESTPRNITTASGGTHLCAVNNGATLTTQIDASSLINDFTYDGTYSSTFNDFFITRIGQSGSTSSMFWGVLSDGAFTPSGGCEEAIEPNEEGLWLYDAFNKASTLYLSYDYAVVRPGDAVALQVLQTDLSGSTLSSPAAGASIAGATSDSNGNVVFTAPLNEGCFQYKATRGTDGRSPAFYLTVLNSFGS